MNHNLKNLAVKIAKETGKIHLEYFGKDLKVFKKTNHDVKINVDRISEKNIINMIKESGMKCRILSEEVGTVKLGKDSTIYRWIIDPLDGTVNYFYGIPHFCVSIALEKDGQIILGVVYDPYRKELFSAEMDKGAYLNNKKIHVSNRKKIKDAIIATGAGNTDEQIKTYLRNYKKIMLSIKKIRISGSAALDLCYVASGRVDGYMVIKTNPWDVAAGAFIAKEAGGKITNLKNEDWNPFNGSIVATNGLIHKKLLELLG